MIITLLLGEHSKQILSSPMTLLNVRGKFGGTTLRSIGDISRHQRLKDNDNESVTPNEMLVELSADNQALTRYFSTAHETCENYNGVATSSMIEVWIDQPQRRPRFLAEIAQAL